jgi:hypothetical protein
VNTPKGNNPRQAEDTSRAYSAGDRIKKRRYYVLEEERRENERRHFEEYDRLLEEYRKGPENSGIKMCKNESECSVSSTTAAAARAAQYRDVYNSVIIRSPFRSKTNTVSRKIYHDIQKAEAPKEQIRKPENSEELREALDRRYLEWGHDFADDTACDDDEWDDYSEDNEAEGYEDYEDYEDEEVRDRHPSEGRLLKIGRIVGNAITTTLIIVAILTGVSFAAVRIMEWTGTPGIHQQTEARNQDIEDE